MKTGTSGQERDEPPKDPMKRDGKGRNANGRGHTSEVWSFRRGRYFQYPVDLSPVRFSRAIDIGSPMLMRYLIDRKTFERVTIIKRKAIGNGRVRRGVPAHRLPGRAGRQCRLERGRRGEGGGGVHLPLHHHQLQAAAAGRLARRGDPGLLVDDPQRAAVQPAQR
jgi:hypothetical protein